MPKSTTKIIGLFLCLGLLMLPMSFTAALEHKFLYFPEPTLVATPAALELPFEEISFNAEDGTRLHGWYLPGEEGQPLVLFCHGNAGNISHRLDNLRLLHNLGVSIFVFDYRGYGHSAGKASEGGTYDDARGALAWLKEQGWSEDRIIYFGRSLGGAVALQLAIEHPPAALVLESTFTSVADMGRRHYPLLWNLGGWLMSARYDNLEKIGRLRSPLLLIHGDRDAIVPFTMGQELFERAPEPKRLYPVSGAGHNHSYEVGGAGYWQAWLSFLDTIKG